MALQDSVKSLMSSNVISVLAETPIAAAMDILLSNNYNGIPVVDKTGVIIGILTKYDLIIKRSQLNDDTKVKHVMNNDPLVLTEEMTVEDAISAFTEHHKVDPIPVVDMDRKVIGMISRYDMVKLFREYGAISGIAGAAPLITGTARNVLWFIILFTVLGLLGAFFYYDINPNTLIEKAISLFR